MKIRFDEAEYTLVGNFINVSIDHFQATVKKDTHTIDEIIEDVKGAEEIRVIEEDGTVVGVYHGYTEIIAVSTFDGVDVSVELLNKDIQTQINSISSILRQVENIQTVQGEMLNQVTEAANGLVESQGTQDLAIEDLAEAVSDLTPEEG